MTEFEKRFSISHENYTDISVYITYNKGDDYRTKRGYYIHVMPVTTRGMFTTAYPQIGYKLLAKEVTRKSKKALDEVIENLVEYAQPIVDTVCNNIEIDNFVITI